MIHLGAKPFVHRGNGKVAWVKASNAGCVGWHWVPQDVAMSMVKDCDSVRKI